MYAWRRKGVDNEQSLPSPPQYVYIHIYKLDHNLYEHINYCVVEYVLACVFLLFLKGRSGHFGHFTKTASLKSENNIFFCVPYY